MVDAVSIALSGLAAQGQRIAASANNIANINTTGALPPSRDASFPTVYKPLSVSYTALTAGDTGAGVAAHVTADPNGYSAVYAPESDYANNEGLIAAPNVDLAQEAVHMMESRLLFRANISVIKTEDKMLGDLINSVV